MSSTTTLRNDAARTGTNPNFPISTNPWRKYLSFDLSSINVAGKTQTRPVRAGVLVIENWQFNAGPHQGENHTLVLVSATSNEIFCFSEGALLEYGTAATPLWTLSLGLTPMTRATSNIAPPIGICGTPLVDAANRRMFVVAMWDDGTGTGNYSIFNIALDNGTVTTSQKLVDVGATGRATFSADTVDQRTAINIVGGWLWFGFADYQSDDRGRYYGWVVAVRPDDLTKQLFQPMVSLNSSNNLGIFAGGVWGPGGVAAAQDGSVFALTGNAIQLDSGDTAGANPQDDLTSFGKDYWSTVTATGPGGKGDYFNALVKLGIAFSGSNPEIDALDYFQGAAFTQTENTADFDFGGSSPVVLPPINGRQLLAFIPKDGDIFVLDTANLGQYSNPLTRTSFGNGLAHGNDTKVAPAFIQTSDGRNILVAAANNSGSDGGFAAFEVDATATPPTLSQLWKSASGLRDSFGSPIVVANPVPDPSNPPSPIGLAWVIDGDDAQDNFLKNCAMRAYDVLTGDVLYDSTTNNDIPEEIPHFTPITSGGSSVFCTTSKGFLGFTQFVSAPKSLSFILDRSTFGKDEVDSLQPQSNSVANFSNAYWIAVRNVLPSDLQLTLGNLSAPPALPTVSLSLDSTLPGNVATSIRNMLNAAKFSGPVIPEKAGLPDVPQDFLFPYTISFTGDQGFQDMATANIGATTITLQASMTVAGAPLSNSAQIELVTGENPYFTDVNPQDPSQPTWLSFDLRLFKVTLGGHSLKFGVPTPADETGAPDFIKDVISNLTANNGSVGGDSFDVGQPDEQTEALEFNPTDNQGNKVLNFALARVRLVGKTTGPTIYPVRVFFRLFQAQNTVSDFNTNTTYRFATDGTQHGRKIPLLGVQSNEYVTFPCFATPRNNLTGPANMADQQDDPNAYQINIMQPGVEQHAFFGCWIDNNQPGQKFLPLTPPAGNLDGPWNTQWVNNDVHSLQEAILTAPHTCLIAEIRYDDAPVIPNATSATSDKLAQRNIAWIDGPNPGDIDSRRMTHPVQIRPTPQGALASDELMILWGATPPTSYAQLYLPAMDASQISIEANRLYPAQHTTVVDPHTIGLDANGVSFVPLPAGQVPAAGLLTVTLPPGIRKGEQYKVTVRQLTDSRLKTQVPPTPQIVRAAATGVGTTGSVGKAQAWKRAVGAFQFVINIKVKEQILLKEERLLATLRWMLEKKPVTSRWFPVLQRYVSYIAGRVKGFGGDPGKILPSPTGWVPGLPHPVGQGHGGVGRRKEFVGKIVALVYDHFGDFEGFIVETEGGHEHCVHSREHAVRDLAVQAKAERRRVRVTTEGQHELLQLAVL